MNRVSVHAARRYEVLIDRGILSRTGEEVRRAHAPCRAAIVTDDIVERLYGDTVSASLEKAGYEACRYSFPNGERSKKLDTYARILDFFAEADITRSDLVVSLGGGVVGDLAGFAASSYLRGVDFIQIPTTYLAAVDAAVGGKTGLNLRAGKNLCGAFYQPLLVLIDCDAFGTLPEERFADGAAETIKYGAIADEALFEIMESDRVHDRIGEIVSRCIQIKADFVAADEFDYGTRRLLNFGHTFGHAIERCSDYGVSHGYAVGTGMLMAAKAAWKMGLCKENCAPRIAGVLEKHRLPLKTEYGAKALAAAMLGDKKRRGDTLSLVLPEKIGLCRVHDIPISELGAFVARALEENLL
jgi:3-dehydroquinate synthase